MTSRTQMTKEKIDKLGFIKTKHLYHKWCHQERRKIAQEQKIFSNHVSNKGLVSRMYK